MREVILDPGGLQIRSELAALERTLDCSGDRITVAKTGEQQKFLALDTAVIDGVVETMHSQVNIGPAHFGQCYLRGLPAFGHRVADDVDRGSHFVNSEDYIVYGILQVQ